MDRVLTCVYCGHEFPQETPAHGDKILTDHITGCEKHPMRAVVEQRDKLYAALASLIGASDPEELRTIEVEIRLIPAPEADKAAAINAIHALIECSEA